jgi:hypothetical protein
MKYWLIAETGARGGRGKVTMLGFALLTTTVIARVDAAPYDETFVSDSPISVRGARGGAWPRWK